MMASKDKTMCDMCSKTVGHLAAMEYVRTQQQMNIGRKEQHTSQLSNSLEYSNQAMRDIMMVQVQSRKRKKVMPATLLKMKGKRKNRNYVGFHNKFYIHLMAMSPKVVHNVFSLALMIQLIKGKNNIKGLTLVRRKRKKNRCKEKWGFDMLCPSEQFLRT